MSASPELEVARRGLAVLRAMRGVAGKLAQVADFVDPAWAPQDERPVLERELRALRAGTPEPLEAKRVERLLRDAWGTKVSAHLAELEPEPAALASAGQVHRAELDDGRAVAVMVLHPGAEEALRADLGNVALLAQLAATVVPGLDPRALAAEVRERALEEMDLEHESQVQRTFARAYRGHPFVFVPAPVTELCRPEVLVSDWVDGTSFEAVVRAPQAERDRYGEILARFHAGAMVHTGTFHADPHPGNHRLLRDGRVAFVDFGATGRADAAWVAGAFDAADAAEAGDGDRFRRDLADLGYLGEPDRVDGRALLRHLLDTGGWILRDERVRIEPALGEAMLRRQFAPGSAAEELVRFGRAPARDVQLGRMLSGLGCVLARLGAEASWGAIAAEYRADAHPATELGEQERDFWSTRGRSRAGAVQELRRAA